MPTHLGGADATGQGTANPKDLAVQQNQLLVAAARFRVAPIARHGQGPLAPDRSPAPGDLSRVPPAHRLSRASLPAHSPALPPAQQGATARGRWHPGRRRLPAVRPAVSGSGQARALLSSDLKPGRARHVGGTLHRGRSSERRADSRIPRPCSAGRRTGWTGRSTVACARHVGDDPPPEAW